MSFAMRFDRVASSRHANVLIQVGNELRQKYGAHILAERILSKIEDDKHYIIDSIRNPSEVDAFRAAKHFKLIRVEAPVEVRFQRILAGSAKAILRP